MPFRGRDGDGEAGRGDRPVLWGLSAWSVAVVTWLTWAPYRLRAPDLALTLGYAHPLEVLGNLVLMAPVAAVMALSGRGPRGRRVVRGGLAALAVSLMVESGQVFIEARHPSPLDLLLNASGAAGLAWVAVELGARVGTTRVLAAFLLSTWALMAAHGLLSAVAVERHHRIRGWEPGYPTLAGDEAGGGRGYVGSVRDPEICAGPGGASVCIGPEAGPEARARLVEAARESQRVRIRARIVSESDLQRGPTRIVTFSESAVRRNLTLGQEDRSLVFRVRTPLAGLNGSAVEFHLGNAVSVGRPTRVSATFDGGRVTLRAVREGDEVAGGFHPGLLQAWMVAALTAPDVEGAGLRARLSRLQLSSRPELNRLRPLTTWAAVVLLFPLAYGAGLRRDVHVLLRLLVGPPLAAGALFAADAAIGTPTPPGVLGIAAGVALAGVAAGAWDARRWRATFQGARLF